MTLAENKHGHREASQSARHVDSDRAGVLMRRATYASVGVALSLIAAKLFAWLLTDSVALLSTLVDSLLDAFASIVNLIAVRAALKPADEDHRFGHGKAESLSAMGQSAFIAGSAVFLMIEAVRRLYDPQPIEHGSVGVAVMIVSIVATLGLVLYQHTVIKRTGSLAIQADSLNYRGDILVNIAVILALIGTQLLDAPIIDPIIASVIALYILWNASRVFRAALDELMDRELQDDQRQRIKEIAFSNPGVLALHDLRTRSSGRSCFIQLHIELSGDQSLRESHLTARAVETGIQREFPDAEVLVRQDPYISNSDEVEREERAAFVSKT